LPQFGKSLPKVAQGQSAGIETGIAAHQKYGCPQMATNKLTDHQCRSAKPGEKPRKIADGHGMYLFISPTGAKIWRVGYRQNGKEGTEVLGPYPLLSLADARIKRDEFRRKLLDGVDVKAKPKKSITFSDAVEKYWLGSKDPSGQYAGGRKDVSDSYTANATRGLAMHLEADIGKTPIGMVTREMILVPLMRLDAAGKHVYAKRLRMWAGLVFDWAVEHGHCAINQAALINPEKAFGRKPTENHAALSLSEIPAFLHRLGMEKELQSVLACRLLALTWVRTGELRMMKWDEVEGDVWRVPGPRMKMKRIHLVPLSRQALVILDNLKARSRGGEYVFPGERTLDRPMSENAVLYLIHRIGYKDRMTGHGWRGVASTWANEHGYNRDHIEMQLAHGSDDAVRSAYNHAAYLLPRRVMLQDFANWIDAQASNQVK
jgi:integrase